MGFASPGPRLESSGRQTEHGYTGDMFTHASDKDRGLLVGLHVGQTTNHDFEVFVQALRELDHDGVKSTETLVSIVVVVPGSSQADAVQRKMIQQAWASLIAPRHVFALVTDSTII